MRAHLRSPRFPSAKSLVVVALASVAGACGDGATPASRGSSCTDTGSACTLGTAGTEAGLFLGSTSEGAGWTREPVGRLVRTHFNSVTSQNELKWGSLVREPGVYDFTRADETVAWAEANGLRMRGHVLFWHRLNALPPWFRGEIDAAADPEAKLRELMREHVQTVVPRYKGRIHTWDVVNEPLALLSDQIDPESVFFQVFDDYGEFLHLAFTLAREADPDAKLFLNEIFPSMNETSFDGLYRLVREMLERGTPIDGVGFQGHFLLGKPDRATLTERLQAFAELGLLVEITELDVSINLFSAEPDPVAAQADVFRDVYAACAAVDGCIGVTTWNSNDGDTWLDVDSIFGGAAPHTPTLFDADLQPKPAYAAARDAVVASID